MRAMSKDELVTLTQPGPGLDADARRRLDPPANRRRAQRFVSPCLPTGDGV